MNYISEYEDLKFEAEMLKSLAFAVVMPFGFLAMRIFASEINFSDLNTLQLTGAPLSLALFIALIYYSHDTMASRERILKRLRNRRTL